MSVGLVRMDFCAHVSPPSCLLVCLGSAGEDKLEKDTGQFFEAILRVVRGCSHQDVTWSLKGSLASAFRALTQCGGTRATTENRDASFFIRGSSRKCMQVIILMIVFQAPFGCRTTIANNAKRYSVSSLECSLATIRIVAEGVRTATVLVDVASAGLAKTFIQTVTTCLERSCVWRTRIRMDAVPIIDVKSPHTLSEPVFSQSLWPRRRPHSRLCFLSLWSNFGSLFIPLTLPPLPLPPSLSPSPSSRCCSFHMSVCMVVAFPFIFGVRSRRRRICGGRCTNS